ncbi:glycosyltransferase family 4 protein [Pelomonas sp. SE-A7]|uniref:glycosyltransferase family 4 protein n=1 Tax=Pelomonas sp. SE-A7 TaxID=3054953 RepID=UPI00259CC7C9|nr:glycosyltransferase family 4 protein [Pelomonas sp. SE-A7]MDM4764881.1 glycosyltransferase family 4 protein [Pelomonas sp. SE-A7]
MSNRPLRLLTFSTLYPSSVRPGHGIFVETRLRELLKGGGIEAKVVAPVPWFPFTHPRFGEYAKMAATPRREQRNGLDVLHPRYLLPPKVGMYMAPDSLARAAIRAIDQLLDEGFDFDVIDAHYYYPDGVAAAQLAKRYGKPLTITARGTDLNLIPAYPRAKRRIHEAALQADASIGVCNALMDVLRGWGLPEQKLNVFRNGVDLERFRPVDSQEAREALGLKGPGPWIISVGYLIERKGHHLTIEALAQLAPRLPEARLVFVGQGEEEGALRALAQQLGVADRVIFAGPQPNTELYRWYSAADLFVLASSREGWANVLLESMACGTPVVASSIWGTPEVVTDPRVGQLVEQRTGPAFAEGIAAQLAKATDRGLVRRYAEGFSWQATSDAQRELFTRLARAGRA